MHFQNLMPNVDTSKRAIIHLIREYLGVKRYDSKVKAAPGTIGMVLGSNGNERIRAAIENAKELDQYWKLEGKVIEQNIEIMNPSVGIYSLVERLLDEIVYFCS